MLVQLAGQSRHRNLREGLVPRPNSGATVGPEYNSILETYIWARWDIERAAEAAPSLSRVLYRMQEIVDQQA